MRTLDNIKRQDLEKARREQERRRPRHNDDEEEEEDEVDQVADEEQPEPRVEVAKAARTFTAAIESLVADTTSSSSPSKKHKQHSRQKHRNSRSSSRKKRGSSIRTVRVKAKHGGPRDLKHQAKLKATAATG